MRRDHHESSSGGYGAARRALIGLVAVLALGAVAIGAALAATTTKKFEAAIGAPAAPSAASQTYTFTLTNDPSSNQALGSANVTVPAGFAVAPGSFSQTVAGGTKEWRPPAFDATTRQIQLRATDSKNALAPTESVVITFAATASCAVTSGPWQTDVKQSNNFLGTGNDFVGPSPSLTVTGTRVATFTFATIAPQQAVGRPIGVKVTALDLCGRVAAFDGKRMVTGLTDVPATELEFVGGVAETTLTPVQQQVGAQLIVDAAPEASNAFDVVTKVCTSGDREDLCEATDAAGTTTVTTARPPTGATMSLDFGAVGAEFSCEGAAITARGAVARIDPTGYTQPIALATRWDKSEAPGTGVANFVFCMSKDAVSYVVVPPCTKAGELPSGKSFCELKRNRNGVGDLVIQYLIAPNDPWGGLG